MVNVAIAFVLWLTSGWLGFHRLYLKRDRAGLVHYFTVAGGFGLGWIIDLFYLNEYVRQANRDREYVEVLKTRQRVNERGPPISLLDFVAMLWAGVCLGWLLEGASGWWEPAFLAHNRTSQGSREKLEAPLWFTLSCLALRALGSLLGVYLAATSDLEKTTSFKPMFLWSLVSTVVACLVWEEPSLFLLCLIPCWAVKRQKRWLTAEETSKLLAGGFCRRLVRFCFGLLVITFLTCQNVYFYGRVTVQNTTYSVPEAIHNVQQSPQWTQFWTIIAHEFRKQRTWSEMGEDILSELDVSGKRRALQVLNLPDDYTKKELREAHRKLILVSHPDKLDKELSPKEREAAAARFLEGQQAYDTLKKLLETEGRDNEDRDRDSASDTGQPPNRPSRPTRKTEKENEKKERKKRSG